MKKAFIVFENDEQGMRQCAAFVAQLVREGVTFSITRTAHGTEVVIEGGF